MIIFPSKYPDSRNPKKTAATESKHGKFKNKETIKIN